MILSESILLCLIGGIAGNIAGVLFLSFFNRSDLIGLGWIPAFVPAGLVLKSLALSVLLGMVSSLYPAILAIRLLPTDALRYE